jgi:type III secretion protein T
VIFEVKTALMALALIVPRSFVCFAILPGFGTRTLVGMARNSVCMAIALPAVVPTFYALQDAPPDFTMVLIIAFKEGLIGALIGTLLAVPIWVVQSMGSIIDLQRTPVQTQNLNASIDQDASGLGAFLLQAAVVVMIQAGLFMAMSKTLLDSYGVWPVMHFAPPLEYVHMQEIIKRFGELMTYVVVYASPVMIPLLLVEMGFAVLGVFAANLQVSTAASPIKSLLGLFVILVYWATLSHYITGDFARQLDLIKTLFLLPAN